MSSFSNAETGSKPADPYKSANKDEPTVEEKFNALDKFVNARKFGMMTTHDPSSGKLVSRCMAVAAKVCNWIPLPMLVIRVENLANVLQEANGTELLFFTNTESNKTDELKNDPQVNISFLDGSGQWASLSGKTSIETDRSIVKKHYSPSLKAWVGDLGDGTHDGSENDPRIGVIRVKIDTATYAITDKTMLGYAVEVAKGAVTGETAAVNKLREITSEEVQRWRNKA
jgi:general stress protein 26